MSEIEKKHNTYSLNKEIYVENLQLKNTVDVLNNKIRELESRKWYHLLFNIKNNNRGGKHCFQKTNK